MAAAVSSSERPIAFAIGAMYFMASPVSATVALVRAETSASTSATCAASEASRQNPRKVVAAISDATARSSPLEAARSSMPGIAATISLVVKPAEARFCMPSAACDALNDVSAPSSFAVSFSSKKSSPVAPVSARTPLIWLSKPLYVDKTSLALNPTPTTESASVIGLFIMFHIFRNGAVTKSFILTATLHVFPTSPFTVPDMDLSMGEALSMADIMSWNLSENILRSVWLDFSTRFVKASAFSPACVKAGLAFRPASEAASPTFL